jgi:hypothetical protein
MSLECEWSNQQTMSVELAIAIPIALALSLFFYRRQNRLTSAFIKLRRSVSDRTFAKTVKSYSIDITIDHPERDDAAEAGTQSLRVADEWVQAAEQDALEISPIDIPGRGAAHEVRFAEGSLLLTLPRLSRSMYESGEYFQTATVHVRTDKQDLLDRAISRGNQPYWELVWYVDTPYDIQKLVDFIKEVSGRGPLTYDQYYAKYNLPKVDNQIASVNIYRESMHLALENHGPGIGFFEAHNLLSPTNVLDCIMNEITYSEQVILLGNTMKRN